MIREDIRIDIMKNEKFVEHVSKFRFLKRIITAQEQLEEELFNGNVVIFADKSETSANGMCYQDILKLEDDGKLRFLLGTGNDFYNKNTKEYIIQTKPFKCVYNKGSIKEAMETMGVFIDNYNYCFSVPIVDILGDNTLPTIKVPNEFRKKKNNNKNKMAKKSKRINRTK